MLAVVVGSARGIGFELVNQLRAEYEILAVDTWLSDELRELVSSGAGVTYRQADVTDLASILVSPLTSRSVERIMCLALRTQNAVQGLPLKTIDQLFVVAGVLGCTQPLLSDLRDVDSSLDLINVLTVNTVGPLNTVRACNARLRDGGTIVFVSSTMGSLHSATHDLNPTYSVSKAGLNMLCRKLSVEMRPRKIDVIAISPGVVQTQMNGGAGDITPEQSVSGILHLLNGPDLSGRFMRYDGTEWPW